jgi:chromosome segregation ATPase
MKTMAPDPVRDNLRSIIAARDAMQTKLDHLRTARAAANDKIGRAVAAARSARTALDEAYATAARATVEAISSGAPEPQALDSARLRANIETAEAERQGYQTIAAKLSEEIAEIEDTIGWYPNKINDAIRDVCAPLVRASLDNLTKAYADVFQGQKILELLNQKNLSDPDLRKEFVALRALAHLPHITLPSFVKQPDIAPLIAALEALQANADAPLPK